MVLTLLGLTLRLWRLGSLGDLDFDEQASAFIGAMDPGSMLGYLSRAPFEHPPLFYLLFHLWITAFGDSETAMRLFAVGPGVAAIPLVGFTVTAVAGQRGGVVAALVIALSPLQVFESRDARMYTLLALLMAVLAAYAARVGVDHATRGARWSRRSIGVLLGVSALALATHYYAVFGVLGVAVGVWLTARARPHPNPLRLGSGHALPEGEGADHPGVHLGSSLAWLTAPTGLALVLGGVWLLLAPGLRLSLTAAYPRFVDPKTLGDGMLQSFGAHVAGPLARPETAAVIGACVAAAVVAAAWATQRAMHRLSPRPGSVSLAVDPPGGSGGSPVAARAALSRVALWGFVATTIGIPLLMVVGRAYAPRFVSLATPFLAILIGCAVAAVPRRWLWPVAAMFVAGSAWFLFPMLTSYARSDYGQALAALRSEVRPDDAIVLNGPWQDLLYRRYGRGLPPGKIIASTVPLVPDEAIGWLQRLTATHKRLWVVDSASDAGDPNGVVAAWLDTHAYPRPVVSYEKALLRPYLTDYDGAPVLTERAVDASALGVHVTSAAADRWTLAPGDEIRLKIRGQRAPREPRLGTSGESARRLAAELVAQDGTSVWHWDGPLTEADGQLEYRAAMLVPPATAPGAYTLRAVVYLARSGDGGRRQITRIAEPMPIASVDVGRGGATPR